MVTVQRNGHGILFYIALRIVTIIHVDSRRLYDSILVRAAHRIDRDVDIVFVRRVSIGRVKFRRDVVTEDALDFPHFRGVVGDELFHFLPVQQPHSAVVPNVQRPWL